MTGKPWKPLHLKPLNQSGKTFIASLSSTWSSQPTRDASEH